MDTAIKRRVRVNTDCPTIDYHSSSDDPPLRENVITAFDKWYDEGKLGFLELPFDDDLLKETLDTAAELSVNSDRMIVCGIGGSSLGLRALLSALGDIHSRVTVADSPDCGMLQKIADAHDPVRTVLTAVTKSGTTAETLAIFTWMLGWISSGEGAESRIVTVTDPSKGDLRKLALERGWHTLPIPPSVGGRFSVMSPAALFPAAFAGIRVEELLQGAAVVTRDFREKGVRSITARMAAGFLRDFTVKPVHVLFTYDDRLFDTALWFSQLWAESLGKRFDLDGNEVRTGQTPLACRGPADQHSLLQLFMEGPRDKTVTIITTPGDENATAIEGDFSEYPSISYLQGRTPDQLRRAEAKATGTALEEVGVPVNYIRLKSLDAHSLGQLLMSLEIATVLSGLALNIDPLDQPGVERSKVLTYRAMKRPGYSAE